MWTGQLQPDPHSHAPTPNCRVHSPTLIRLSLPDPALLPLLQGHIMTPIAQQLPRYSMGLREMGCSDPQSQLRRGTEWLSGEDTTPHW